MHFDALITTLTSVNWILFGQVLRQIYGDRVGVPVSCAVTNWTNDEHSGGSYSYVAVGASAKDYDYLALPVGRRVLFAGVYMFTFVKITPQEFAMLVFYYDGLHAFDVHKPVCGCEQASFSDSVESSCNVTIIICCDDSYFQY